MKVITIGRDLDNDIVINDDKASRHHLQIIKEDSGNFRIIDFGSTNGTFVNERKITGEIAISTYDTVRIGNTSLPWQNYFPENKSIKSNHPLVWVAGIFVTLAIFTLIYVFVFNRSESRTIVKMSEKNGVLYVPMKINGQELDFVFDTGASSICISTLEAAVLVKNGSLTADDLIGEQGFVDATGRISVGARINLKTVKIGNRELNNVEATIIENPSAECLLGQTVLSRFGAYTIDNTKKEIIFE